MNKLNFFQSVYRINDVNNNDLSIGIKINV